MRPTLSPLKPKNHFQRPQTASFYIWLHFTKKVLVPFLTLTSYCIQRSPGQHFFTTTTLFLSIQLLYKSIIKKQKLILKTTQFLYIYKIRTSILAHRNSKSYSFLLLI